MKNVIPTVDRVHFPLPIHISLIWINYIMNLISNLKRKLLSEVYSRDLSNFFPNTILDKRAKKCYGGA